MAEGASSPKSIFETASQMERERRRKEAPASTLSLDEMFQRCMKFHQNIQSSLDKVFSANRLTPNQFQKYMATPENFSEKDWDAIKEQKLKNDILIKELANKLLSEAAIKEKEKKELLKEGKKPRVLRRSQWLGMR
jgi:hypothetical protein